MKLLTLIVHTNVQQELSDLLRSIDQVTGYTFTHLEGHGSEIEKDSFELAREETIGYVSRIRTDILLKDEDAETVLNQICDKEHNISGQGMYWITAVEKGGEIL